METFHCPAVLKARALCSAPAETYCRRGSGRVLLWSNFCLLRSFHSLEPGYSFRWWADPLNLEMSENETFSMGSIRAKWIISDSPGRSNIWRQKWHKEIKVQIKQARGTLAASVCSAFPAHLVLDIHASACSENFPSLSTLYILETVGTRGLWALLWCLNGQNIQIPFVSVQLKHTLLESTAGNFQALWWGRGGRRPPQPEERD